jgi:hypothetical protein
MDNYFTIILDTSAPNITVATLGTITPSTPSPVHIAADEPLGTWQDVYFIDSTGARFDVPVLVSDDKMSADGTLLADAADGIGTLYVQLADEVDNRSNIVTVGINCLANFNYTWTLKLLPAEYKATLKLLPAEYKATLKLLPTLTIALQAEGGKKDVDY